MSTPNLTPIVLSRSRVVNCQSFHPIAVVLAAGISSFLFWRAVAVRSSGPDLLRHRCCYPRNLKLAPVSAVAGYLAALVYVATLPLIAYLVYKAKRSTPFAMFLACVPFMIACGAVGGDGVDGGSVRVSVAPANITVLSNQKQMFTANITGVSNTDATWSATLGSIDINGLYTAPTVNARTSAVVTATSKADSSVSASAAVTVTPLSGQALQITTGNLPEGQQGIAYSEDFTATGGTTPYSWNISAGAPPPGITMSANGDFAGVPTSAGTFNFTVLITDANGQSATRKFSVAINTPPLQITTRTLPQGQQGIAYSEGFTATGGVTPYSWSTFAGAPPTGITMNATGNLAGVPTSTGTFNFTVLVTDANGTTATGNFSITVMAQEPPVTSITSPTGGTVSGVVPVIVSASGNVGVASVELWVDGVNSSLTPSVSGSTYTFMWDTSALAGGSDTIQAKAYDAAHDVGSSSTVTVTVATLLGGPPNYMSYGGQDIVIEPDPLPNLASDATGLFKNDAIVYDTSYANGNAYVAGQTQFSPYIRCTDANSQPDALNATYSTGLGGSGMGILFNADDTLIHMAATPGGNPIIQFDPVRMVCASTVITQGQNSTQLRRTNLATQDFGGGNFSLNDPGIWIASGITSDVKSQTAVTQYTFDFSKSPIEFSVGPTLADFAYGLPLGANISEWQPGNYAYGAYVQHTLRPGEYLDPAMLWSGSGTGAAVAVGDLTVSPGGCGFKVVAAGATGGARNPLPTSSKCGSLPKVTDGTATWEGINGPLVFSYQVTTPTNGGTSVGPVSWLAGNGHPDIGSLIPDGAIRWTNVGPVQVPQWSTWGNSSRDNTKFESAFSSNAYGNASLDQNHQPNYTSWFADQGSGIYAVEYDATTNIYHQFNTWTQILVDYLCSIPNGDYRCSDGTWTPTTVGQALAGGTAGVAIGGATQSVCPLLIHNAKMNTRGTRVVFTDQGNPSRCIGTTKFYVWRTLQTPFDVTTQFLEVGLGLNHGAICADHYITLKNGGSTASSGVYMSKMDLDNPVASTIPYFFQIAHMVSGVMTPDCTIQADGPPYLTPTCKLGDAIDNHVSCAYDPDDGDTWPTVGATYNYATLDPRPFQAYQDEIVGSTTSPTWTDSTDPDAREKQWRFGHIGALGTDDLFNLQFSVGQFSQTGRFYAVGTPYRGLFGSNTGAVPTEFPVTPAGPAPRCMGGYPWLPSFQYRVGDIIHPIGGTSGSGEHYPVMIVTSISGTGTSGTLASYGSTRHPAWPSLAAVVDWSPDDTTPCANASCVTDNAGPNQIVWTPIAKNSDCRGDTIVFKLQ